MGKWPEETRAALCQEYAPRDPFAEFARGEISISMLRMLIKHLYAWTLQDELAAVGYDQLQVMHWAYTTVNRAENMPVPEFPDLYARPWDIDDREAEQADKDAGVEQAHDWFVQNVESQVNGEAVS